MGWGLRGSRQHLDSANPVWPDVNISEDCLFLNIFTPDRPDKTMTSSPSAQKGTVNTTGSRPLAPVLLYLHGVRCSLLFGSYRRLCQAVLCLGI